MTVRNRGLSTIFLVCCLGLLTLAAAGCGASGSSRAPDGLARLTPYLPPTMPAPVPTAAGIVYDPTPDLRPSPTPPCSPNLLFKEDLSIPDGALVKPGEKLDKRWQVENSGTCNWDEQYRIRLIAGPDLGATTEQALYPARSGSPAVIRIEFTAPAEEGTYRSAWQAHTPGGIPFGDLFFVEFVVAGQP